MNTSLRLARGRPRRRPGSTAGGVGGAALVMAALVPVAPAVAAPSTASSTTPSATTVVSGRLTGGDGHPVAGRVLLLLDPGARPVGSDVTVPVVASTSVGADGAYQLALAPGDPAVAAALAANHGWVNVLVVAQANGLQATVEKGATVANPVGWVDRNGGTSPLDITLAPGRPGVATLSPAQWAAAADPSALAPPCRYTVIGSQQAPTVVGELHKWKDTTASFSYGQTADSDIGVGVNATGSGWSLGGTVHISQSSSATVGWGGWDANGLFGGQLQTEFQYELRRWNNAPGSTYCGVESIVPVQWNGGSLVGADVHQYDGHCDTSSFGQVYKSGFFERTSNRAYHYYGAVNAFGVGLDAQSGYSSFVQAHWNFGTASTNHWMCGNDGPTTTASIVYAGPNS